MAYIQLIVRVCVCVCLWEFCCIIIFYCVGIRKPADDRVLYVLVLTHMAQAPGSLIIIYKHTCTYTHTSFRYYTFINSYTILMHIKIKMNNEWRRKRTKSYPINKITLMWLCMIFNLMQLSRNLCRWRRLVAPNDEREWVWECVRACVYLFFSFLLLVFWPSSF